MSLCKKTSYAIMAMLACLPVLTSCAGPSQEIPGTEASPLKAFDDYFENAEHKSIAETVDNALTALAIRNYERLGTLLKLDEGQLQAAQGDSKVGGQLAAAIFLGANAERTQLLAWQVELMDIKLSSDQRWADARVIVTLNQRQKLKRTPREVEFAFRLCKKGSRWLIVM